MDDETSPEISPQDKQQPRHQNFYGRNRGRSARTYSLTADPSWIEDFTSGDSSSTTPLRTPRNAVYKGISRQSREVTTECGNETPPSSKRVRTVDSSKKTPNSSCQKRAAPSYSTPSNPTLRAQSSCVRTSSSLGTYNDAETPAIHRREAPANTSGKRVRPINLYSSTLSETPTTGYSSDTSLVESDFEEAPQPQNNKTSSEPDLQEVKQLLHVLCKKVEGNEKSLNELRTSQCSTKGSSSFSAAKRTIPLIVRQEVRKTYGALMNEDDNFSGWNLSPGVSIKSSDNQAIISKLTKEVKGLNPSFSGADIRDAAYRFYRSKCEQECWNRKGKTEERKIFRRRHERIVRKRKEREAAVQKNGRLTEDQKKKWLSVMKNEYMSSEESGEDDSIIIHPLQWRSDYVNRMFEKITAFSNSKKSDQARRQMKARVIGSMSTRLPPSYPDVPVWAVKDN